MIQDPLEDVPRMDHFGEHREECNEEGTADTPPTDAALCKEESMNQTPQPGLEEEEGSNSSQDLDSLQHTPCHYSSRCCCHGSVSWVDEQEEGKEQEEAEQEEQLSPPASPQKPMEKSPALE